MCKENNCENCMFADISPMSKLDTICLDKSNANYGKIVSTYTEKECVKVGKSILLSKH